MHACACVCGVGLSLLSLLIHTSVRILKSVVCLVQAAIEEEVRSLRAALEQSKLRELGYSLMLRQRTGLSQETDKSTAEGADPQDLITLIGPDATRQVVMSVVKDTHEAIEMEVRSLRSEMSKLREFTQAIVSEQDDAGLSDADVSPNRTTLEVLGSSGDSSLKDLIGVLVQSKLSDIRSEKQQFSASIYSSGEGEQDEELDPSDYPELWNINTISVGFWKSVHWPVGQKWNSSRRQFVAQSSEKLKIAEQRKYQRFGKFFLWTFLLGIFPICYNILLMTTITGVYDEGLNMKTHISGDGYYQSWTWRFSGGAHLRTKWVPDLDPVTGEKLGLTSETVGSRNMLKFRDKTEIEHCQEDKLFRRMANYTGDYADFWPLMLELQTRTAPEYLFSHCLPWEYANICYNLIRANEKLTGDAYDNLPYEVAYNLGQGIPTKGENGRPWYIVPCYPTDYHSRPLMRPEQWKVLIVSTDEMRESSANLRMPARIEEHQYLVRWVMAKNLGDAKSLDSSDDSVSNHLYHHSHMVYYWSYGESALVELICISTLNFYLYYSAIYPEMQQMLEQVLSPTPPSHE